LPVEALEDDRCTPDEPVSTRLGDDGADAAAVALGSLTLDQTALREAVDQACHSGTIDDQPVADLTHAQAPIGSVREIGEHVYLADR
jgi:hypothetical protein